MVGRPSLEENPTATKHKQTTTRSTDNLVPLGKRPLHLPGTTPPGETLYQLNHAEIAGTIL